MKITKLPHFLVVCPLCKGAGHFKQTYTIGCGRGYTEMDGCCDMCSREREMFCGPGILYRNGEKVPDSVVAQVLTMNGIEASVHEWTVNRQVAFPGPEQIVVAEVVNADEAR